MVHGISFTIGVILVIASRIFYCLYDITLGGSIDNNLNGCIALSCDVLGTALVVLSVINGILR